MSLNKKYIRSFIWVLMGGISLLILQTIWIHRLYRPEYNRLIIELKEALSLAYQKEQTYRIPVVDIINPGEVTIQGCGNEEIIIIRKCFENDTIVYNNVSGHSVEKFINHVFQDLRESIVPMNLHCLSDLFAGILHDKNIPLTFIIERYNSETGTVLESTLLPGEKQIRTKYENTIVLEISDTEVIRAILQLTPGIIFRNMTDTLLCSALLIVIILLCMVLLYKAIKQTGNTKQTGVSAEQVPNNTFRIGEYSFNPFKNELQGFGETIQLNKKENSILYALCNRQGNVVERNALLEENWGSSGIIYSRSLDTYLASLRKYLKKDPHIQIVTVKGLGYKLVCANPENS